MLGEVPEGWREAPFSALARYDNGRAFKPTDWGGEGLPIVRIAQITNPDADTNRYSGEVDSRHLLINGDLIFSWSATLAVMKWRRGPAVLNQHLFKVTPTDGIDQDWLQFRLEASIPDLSEEAHGTTMKHIRKGTLSSQTTLVPPLDEQRRIAEVLRSVSDGVAASDAALQATTSVRQATLDSIMRKETVPADFSPLASVAEVRTGLAKNAGREGVKVSLPYLRVANVQDGWIDLADVKSVDVDPGAVSRYSLQKGDVLLTEGGDYDKLGRGGVWGGKIEPCLHQNHVFAVRPDQTKLSSEFLALLTQSYLGRTYFLSCAKRTTNLASINSSQLKNLPVPKLPLKRQQEIVSEVGSIDRVISIEKERRDATRRLQRALSSDLLSGRVRVPA